MISYSPRYSYSSGYNVNPISVRGSPLPGFPVRDDLGAHSAVLADTHLISPTMTNSARVSFLRYAFNFDQRLINSCRKILVWVIPHPQLLAQAHHSLT